MNLCRLMQKEIPLKSIAIKLPIKKRFIGRCEWNSFNF